MTPGSVHDAYSEPVSAEKEWWGEVAGQVVRKVLIWGGGGEVLIDSISEFAGKVGSGFASVSGEGADADGGAKGAPRFRFVVTPGCAHEEMIIDELAFGWVKGAAAKEVEERLSAVLSSG